MTESQICSKARALAPRIQLRDVWFLVRQCSAQGLTYCLNPGQVTGKLYFLTDLGRAVVEAAFGQKVDPCPPGIDWKRYALVVRAKIRCLVLQEIAKPCRFGRAGITASEIRRRLL